MFCIFKKTAIAGLITSSLFGAHVNASILSFSDVVASGFNTGTYSLQLDNVLTRPGSDRFRTDYAEAFSNFSVISIPATTTSAGLALDYTRTTTSYIDHKQDYKYDTSYVSVSAPNATTGSNQYLTITGKVKSSVDTEYSFELFARGAYATTTIPGVGSVPNGAISFFTGPDAQNLAGDRITTTYFPDSSSFNSYSYGNNSVFLTAGVELSFAALVYSQDASLTNFSITGRTSAYDIVTKSTAVSFNTDRLVGSSLISPVPEPESYAMLLAGLSLMGVIARRRKAKQV